MNGQESAVRQLRIFLCHCHGDKPQVRNLYAQLRQEGFAPWFDEEDLIPGQDWKEEISKAIRASDVVLVCLSKSSLTKEGFVHKEIQFALDRADEKPPDTIFIIPARLEDVNVPERLRRWQWVNLFDEFHKLLRALMIRSHALGIGEVANPTTNISSFGQQPELSAPKLVSQDISISRLTSLSQVSVIEAHSSVIRGIAVTPDGKRAISASHDRTIKLWNLENGIELCALEGHSSFVHGVAVTPDGKCAISASSDQTLKVWDLESGRTLHTLKGHSQAVRAVAVTPDGRRAISASHDGTLRVWYLENGHELRTLKGHSSFVQGVAVTPDGKRAISASSDQTLKLWNLENGQTVRTFKGHSQSVRCVVVSSDGRYIVSGSEDQTLKIWDLESGRTLRTLKGFSGFVSGVAITANGQRAISTSYDQKLKVWDLESGLPLATFGCEGEAFCCACTDNRCIVGDGRGRIYVLSIIEK
jgi:sugar lactone lactonase YvrE